MFRFTPFEIALAVPFGILLGLLPKGNLLFLFFAVFFSLSRNNLIVGFVTAIIVSLFAPFAAPLADSVGREILTHHTGQSIIGTILSLPLLAWTMLDNTLVLGFFVLGAVQFLPVFLFTRLTAIFILPSTKKKE